MTIGVLVGLVCTSQEQVFAASPKKRSLSGLAAKVQELHGSEVCLTKLKVIETIFENNGMVHMRGTSAKNMFSHQ